MQRNLSTTNTVIAAIGIVVGLFISMWFGIALVVLAILLHFLVPDESRA